MHCIFDPFFSTKDAPAPAGLWWRVRWPRSGRKIRARSSQRGRAGAVFSVFLPEMDS